MKPLFKNILISTVFILSVNHNCRAVASGHPCLYVSNEDRGNILSKIKQEGWAGEIWANMKSEIDPYVARHVKDPKWIISRLAMYWKKGEHFTQCYLKNETWDYGTGNAPVPTLRLPGMRVWNDYINVPLADRIPFNETGDMKALSRSNPSAPSVMVPYKKSGHLIRQNNTEILGLAEKAAFIYWLTGEEKYAKFSSDIFQTALLGVYYMQPILDPEKSSGGAGGYSPGGSFGYYDYEQIHDDIQVYLATTYDFLYGYLKRHPDGHLGKIKKDITHVAGDVFKRFVEIGLVRGGKFGNWNVNGFDIMHRSMLVLEPDSFYTDGKGREYYIPYYTTKTTDYHQALPDILQVYDPVTGLWPEAPGYASGTIVSLLNMVIPFYRAGVNTISGNPTMQKAALANLNWLDSRGNLVVIGDMRGGPLSMTGFERLLTYYTWTQDKGNADIISSVIKKALSTGQYSRSNTGWSGLCLNSPLTGTSSDLPYKEASYSAKHRHIIMKNGNNEENGLMFTLYGGTKGSHLSSNGLAMQLYGKGWALAPDASAYESYWAPNYAYHQSATGVNTILPGYTDGPIIINAMDPSIKNGEFTNTHLISPNCSFADVSASEKRRLVGMVRTSPTTGYYFDIFRSNQSDNDYLYHNLGNSLTVMDSMGKPLSLTPADDLGNTYNKAYSYFSNPKKIRYVDNFHAQWQITSTLNMEMWMLGQPGRQLYSVSAPSTTLIQGVTPENVNKSPQETPTLIVRQTGCNAQEHPFVAVFEPCSPGNNYISQMTNLASKDNFVGFIVDLKQGSRQYILNSIDDKRYAPVNGMQFQGILGIVSQNGAEFQYLYLGRGRLLKNGPYSLEAISGDATAELHLKDGKLYYSSDREITITLPGRISRVYPEGYNVEI